MGESVIPEGWLDVYKEGLRNLDYVSVREKTAQELLGRISGRSVKWVLDPTLLLNREDWDAVASDSIKIEKPYVFSYSLNSSPRYVRAVRKCADKLGLQVVNVMTSLSGLTDKSFVNVYGAGPKEFLGLLRNARFVCTNSFHGTAFAINFGIPFLSILNRASGGNSRILSIAAALGLSNRVIMDDASPWEGIGEIDFEGVRAKLDEFRNASGQFLEGALG